MSLDAVTIVGLVLGILGLWGLPTLWKRVLYASKVPRQRAKINARITHLLDSLHDRTSGNLRGVDGFEAQVEDIERRYLECYTEMTFAYSALQWLMWIVWCFRADPYLSKLFALQEELSSLLERIRDRNNLGNIVTTAVTTAERDHARTPLGMILPTIISIVDLIRNVHIRQLYKRDHADQNARPSNAILLHAPSANTVFPPTTREGYTYRANSSPLSGTAVSDHASFTLTCHVSPALATPTSRSPFADGHTPNILNVAEPSVLRLPAHSTKMYLPSADGRPFPSECEPSTAMSSLSCRPDARNPEHSTPLHTTISSQVSNSCDVGEDTSSSRADNLPVKPAHGSTIGAGEALVFTRESSVRSSRYSLTPGVFAPSTSTCYVQGPPGPPPPAIDNSTKIPKTVFVRAKL